jgi:cytochrome c-type biogenesis protein CcmH
VLLPAGALGLYLVLGSPQMPGEPLAARMRAEQNNPPIEALVTKVEEHIARNPDDGRGWEVLAPVYMRLGRFDDSIRAWRNVIRLNGANADRESRLGEALVAAANGVVTAEAKSAFDRASALDKTDVKTRFYLGMAADQDGNRAQAESIWRDLLASAPPDAPWAEIVRHALDRGAPGAAANAATSASPPTPGPGAADAAAAQMKPDEQNQMIVGMVARLADRLKQDGSDVEGWLRLVRAYKVLGERDKAQAAASDARRALAAEPDKIRRIDELAKELGLNS